MEGINLGKAYVVTFVGCGKMPESAEQFTSLLKEAAEAAGATYCGKTDKDFGKDASSSVILLAESHYGGHSFPEYGKITATFYTCGKIDSRVAAELFGKKMEAKSIVGIVYCFETNTVETLNMPLI